MNRLITLLCLLIAFSGCSVQKRAERKLRKACELYPPICAADTLSDTTFIVEEFPVHDTSYVTKPNDTIEIINEKVYTRIIREHDTLEVYQEVKPDTIVQIKEVRVPQKIVTDCRPWWHYVLLTLGMLIFAMWIRNRVWSRL